MTAPSPRPSSPDAGSVRQWMSALADGRADALHDACAAWSDDPQAREAWHTYHLIGDVLRSDDLAAPAAHDEVFLSALRTRLAQEPAIVAPAPMVAPQRAAALPTAGSRRWAVAAAAAGVMMVGGAAVMLRESGSGGAVALQTPPPRSAAGAPSAPLAGGGGSAAGPILVGQPLGDPQWRVLDGQMIRDARLDDYLRAHRGTLAARPGAVGGRYETVVLER